MPSKPTAKRKKGAAKRKGGGRVWLRRLALTGLGLSVVGGATAGGALWWFGRDLPRLISLDDYRPPQATLVYSADGMLIGRFARERRTVVLLDKIPEAVRDAFVDAEDAAFFQHKGVDFRAMVRAFLAVVRSGGKFTQGASTITQQVVRTFLLSREKRISRKIKEIILAWRLEKNLSKEDILTLYLNQIYFGHGMHGLQEAARFYFGKDVDQLGVSEAAMLAGLLPGPELYSPLKNPEGAKKRRAYVLGEMVKRKHLDRREAERIGKLPLDASRHTDPGLSLAPHFVEHVRRTLNEELGHDMVYTGGLQVHTSLDAKLQEAANKAVAAGLRAVDRRRRFTRPLRRLKHQKERVKFKASRKKEVPAPGRIVEALVIGRSKEPAGYELRVTRDRTGLLQDEAMGRYTPDDKPVSSMYAVGDVIRVSVLGGNKHPDGRLRLEPELGPQAALVSIDPATRRVVALVGGDPHSPDSFNRVTQAKRQPGSAFKPIIYASALATRRIHLASIYNDAPEIYRLPRGRWAPQNYDRKFRGPLRLREALAQSVNMVAIKILRDVGVGPAIAFAHKIGISSDLAAYLPLALGASVVSPLELANVYAVMPSGGRLASPVMIDRVEGPTGATLFTRKNTARRVMDPALAYLVSSLMTTVVERGTAGRAKSLGRKVAGKTGTTSNHTDAWFSGFSPQLVTTVWVGFDDNRSLGSGEQGSKTALPIWVDFMKVAMAGKPVLDFAKPDRGLEVKRIDKETGLLAPEGLAEERVMEEVFLTGSGPTEHAALPDEVTAASFLLDQFGFGGGGGGDVAPEGDPGPPNRPPPPLPPGMGTAPPGFGGAPIPAPPPAPRGVVAAPTTPAPSPNGDPEDMPPR